MPTIKSSIGESSSNVTGKRWSVPDLDQQAQPQEPVYKTINPLDVTNMRRQAQERAQEAEIQAVRSSQQRIDMLTGLGRRTVDVPINDSKNGIIVFTLRTLKVFEKRDYAKVMTNAEKVTLKDGSVSFSLPSTYDVKRESISNSLYLIDGLTLDMVLGTSDCSLSEQKSAKDWLIENMDDEVVDRLFEEYNKLIKSYKQPSTPEEVSEVVDAINKSGETT
jgi:hypothetical protein